MEQKVSIVLAAYNGSRFIIEQLDSLRKQSRTPDEVIILDDCSTDDTVSLAENYIAENALSGWKLIRNEKNQGWKKNFTTGFDMAEGDIIFPCDQDDIWHEDKLEKMLDIMKKMPEIELLVSDFTVFYSGAVSRDGYSKVTKILADDGNVKKIPFTPKWRYIIRPGCVFAFRKTFYQSIRKYWDSNNAHDANLWRFSIIRNSLYIYHYSTIDFRRHGDNVTGKSIINRFCRIEDCVKSIEETAKIKEIAQNQKLEIDYTVFDDQIEFLKNRKLFFETKKIKYWLKLLFEYNRYYLSKKSVFGDLINNYKG